MDEQNLTKGQILEQQSAEERIAFAAFKKTYLSRVPSPTQPPRMNLKNLGFQFYLYFTQAISSIALAAMRTWEAFYRVGMLAGHGSSYALLEAWLAVLVVEVGMVTYAASNANKRYHKTEQERQLQAAKEGTTYVRSKKVETNGMLLGTGLVILLLLSTAAGLDQAVRAIKNVSPDFLTILSYSLNVAIGVGVSVIAFIGGEILGQQLAIVTADYDDLTDRYEAEVKDYQEELEATWSRSDERRVIRAEVRQAAKGSQSTSPLSRPLSGQSVDFSQGGAFGNGRRPAVTTTRVYQYMDQILQTENRIPSFSEVQQTLDIPKSTASKLRLQWLDERGYEEKESGGSQD